MIRHIVLFKVNEGVSTAQEEKLVSELKGLKEKISVVKELEIGIDVGKKPNSYDIALDAVFENMEDLKTYAIHPEHIKVVDLIKEFCQPAVKVDFEF